jgi:hypothetical protein
MLDMNARGTLQHTLFSSFSTNTIHDADHDCTSTTEGIATNSGEMLATATPIVDPNVLEQQAGAVRPQPKVMTSVMVRGDAEPTQTYRRVACNGEVSTFQDSHWAFYGPEEGLPATLTPTLGDDLVGTQHKQRTNSFPGGSTRHDTLVEVWHKPQL